ncbi:MAG TPA: hypothetical protein VF064_17200 [Pyrinomonadaceae bacterium]
MSSTPTDGRFMRCYKGVLTDEGVECQAFRSEDGELFTLLGDLGGFSDGDKVVVCGTIAEISPCMQGTTLVISFIGKKAPRAKKSVAASARAKTGSSAKKAAKSSKPSKSSGRKSR